ncbi:MAG: carboxymuconolactone decarboxylase family protein [Syntrophomonadaceae bacterium]
MEPRIDFTKVSPGAIQAMQGLGKYLDKSGLETSLMDLVKVRASVVNGCAYCLDMHWKDARQSGETEQRLYGLAAWQEAPYYSDRERAALAWTDAVTRLGENRVPDDVFREARRQFREAELVDLTLCVVAINGWNRLCISFRAPAGTYQPVRRPERPRAEASRRAEAASH